MELIGFLFILIVFLVIVVFFLSKNVIRENNRKKIMKNPFPLEWEHYLEDNYTLFSKMPAELQSDMKNKIKVFLNEKTFIGCEGLEITDQIRVLIAAQACLLILNRKTTYYPKLRSIFVYPTSYLAKRVSVNSGIVTEKTQVTFGESWGSGELVLAWDASVHGAKNMFDSRNVVYHEFAHQLDQEDGVADGAPILENRSSYASWARVLSREFENLKSDKKRWRKTVLNKYGATNPAEFFAVASESFFEKPRQLIKKHPELYQELKSYYRTDPIDWMD
jgi:Mlc titration factor MtfA (ptsG expression regulator)